MKSKFVLLYHKIQESGTPWKVYMIAVVVVFVFLTEIAISPLQKLNALEKSALSDSLYMTSFDSAYFNPELSVLAKEKSYREAMLELAASDSIQLIIDIPDSSISLSIKGVIIHHSRMTDLSIDPFFSRITLPAQLWIFSSPLEILKQQSTIIKEPVVEREAPKDTAEANQNAWQPDTLIQHPAFLRLSTTNGFRISVEQDRNVTAKDRWSRFFFHINNQIQNTGKAVWNFILLRKQDYHPEISISLPADEIRSVYRALPEKAYVVIKIQ